MCWTVDAATINSKLPRVASTLASNPDPLKVAKQIEKLADANMAAKLNLTPAQLSRLKGR